mmetsp:Transcript_43959/g.146489  ORF Transcript_43959/g.146489 Transcript_43959/m.146489 type:complete len:412 (+) Transcript_43959:339-1574(+)
MPGHVPHAEQVCALALLRRKRRPLRSLGVVDASVHLDAARDGVKDGDGELGEHRVGAADDVEEEVGKGLQVLAHLRLGPLRVRPQHGRLDDALKVERRLADQRRGRLALVAEKGARQAEVEALVVDDLAALVAVGGAQVSRAQAERVQGELQPAPCALQVGSSPLEPRLDDRAVLFKLRVQPRARESRPRLASREGSLPAAASAARVRLLHQRAVGALQPQEGGRGASTVGVALQRQPAVRLPHLRRGGVWRQAKHAARVLCRGRLPRGVQLQREVEQRDLDRSREHVRLGLLGVAPLHVLPRLCERRAEAGAIRAPRQLALALALAAESQHGGHVRRCLHCGPVAAWRQLCDLVDPARLHDRQPCGDALAQLPPQAGVVREGALRQARADNAVGAALPGGQQPSEAVDGG